MTLISSNYRLILLHQEKSLFCLFWHHTYLITDHIELPAKAILSQLSSSLFPAAQTSCQGGNICGQECKLSIIPTKEAQKKKV